MSLQRALIYELVQDSGVSAKVSTRVYPIRPPRGQATKYPLLLVNLRDSEHGSTSSGADGLAMYSYEITVEAETYGELEATAKTVRVLLHGNTGDDSFGDLANSKSVEVLSITASGTRDSYDGPSDGSDRGVYVRELDFDIWWREPTS